LILADRFAEDSGLFGSNMILVIRSFGEGAPNLFACFDIVGRDMALHAKLTAGNTDQDLVFDDQRRRVPVAPLLGSPFVTVHSTLPVLASRATSVGIGLMQENLAVAIGHATVHRVAAHHGMTFGSCLGSYFQTILLS